MSDIDLITSNRINNLDNDLIDIRTSIETNYNQLLSELNSLRTELTNADSVIQSDLNTKYNELLTKINNNYDTLNTSLTNVASRVTTLESRKMVKETYKNGDNWYRIWTDGWIEQGGYVNATGDANITTSFHKQFTATPTVIKQTGYSGTFNNAWNWVYAQVWSVTTSSFTHRTYHNASGGSCRWYACGF
jgi:hypothetical protein